MPYHKKRGKHPVKIGKILLIYNEEIAIIEYAIKPANQDR